MMKIATRITASLLIASVLLAGCSRSLAGESQITEQSLYMTPNVISERTPITDRAAVDFNAVDHSQYQESAFNGYLEFAMNLYASEASKTDSNMMISPASIFLALGMTSAGAAGDTLTQMTDVMTPGATPEELQGFGGYYYRTLLQNSGITLHTANSIWLNNTRADSVYQDYLDFVTLNYGADIGMISMNSEGEETINSWVNRQTFGMIPAIISPGSLNSRDMAVLVNAVAFEANWADGELDTCRGPFTNPDGSEKRVDMLQAWTGIYICNDEAYGSAIRYEGGQYALMALMPTDPSVDADTFASNLTAEGYMDLWNSRSIGSGDSVHVTLPEFSYDYDTELSSQLQAMGMTAPFDELSADFANMTDERICISEVIHVTHIEVDNTGTRASAATAVTEACAVSAPDDPLFITFDRPFIYAIVDIQTGLPLFIGTVNYL